jgi:hypothetical protein
MGMLESDRKKEVVAKAARDKAFGRPMLLGGANIFVLCEANGSENEN